MKIIPLLFLLFSFLFSVAQDSGNKEEWLPVFENKLPTPFFRIIGDYLFQHSINSTSEIEEIGDGHADVLGNRIITIGMKFPILSKSKVVLTGGLKYTDEEFFFRDYQPEDYPLYVSLNDRNLKSLGGDLNGLIHLGGNRSVLLRSSFYLAGDFYRSDEYFTPGELLKISLAVGFGVKKDINTYLAFGGYFGYTFGRPSFYPAIIYSKRYGNGLGVDIVLPQSFRVWKKVSDKFYYFGRTKISGNSYTIRLTDSILEEAESLQLRQSNIVATAGLYQKLAKWIWLEAEAGYSHYLNFNISESNFVQGSTLPKPDTDYLIKSEVTGAPFIRVSLFLAPPKDFLDKLLN